MRSARLFVVALLAVVLVLSSAQNAFAVVTLSYDNGTYQPLGFGETYWGVKFSLPSGVSSARLRYVRWAEVFTLPRNLTIIITGPDHLTLIASPILLGIGPGLLPGIGCPPSWTSAYGVGCFGLDLTGYGIVVTGDFFVIVEETTPTGEPCCLDGSLDTGTVVPPPARSFLGDTLAGLLPMYPPTPNNFLMRVDVDPISPTPVKASTSAGTVQLFGSMPTGIIPLTSAPTEAQALSYPYGFFVILITGIAPGSTVTVTLTLTQSAEGVQLWKYNTLLAAWQQIPVFSTSGNDVSFKVTDGGTFDEDTIAGQITDPIGAGFAGAPVGGFIEPVNAFAVLSPSLAVIGLVGCIGVVVVVAKKRRQ